MADYRNLIKVLEKELGYQSKLLELLIRERTAITTMRNDELVKISSDKELLLAKAKKAGEQRNMLISELGIDSEQALKLKEIAQYCDDIKLRKELVDVGEELKIVVAQVRTMNDHNAELIKSSIGIVLSTISIFRGAADADLPTYASTGKLKTDAADPAFRRSLPISREG